MSTHKLYLCKDGIEIEATVQIPIIEEKRTIIEKISYQQEAIYKNLELIKITPILEENILKKILLEVKRPMDSTLPKTEPHMNQEEGLLSDYKYLGQIESVSKREYNVYENKYFYRLIKISDTNNQYTYSKIRYEEYLLLLKDCLKTWKSAKTLGLKYNWVGTLLAMFFKELEVKTIPTIDKVGHPNRTYHYKITNNTIFPVSRKPPDSHMVQGYTKEDGTYVAPHMRGK